MINKEILPNTSDLLELERLYRAAQSDVGKTEWEEHYPNYPETVEEFFRYITSSVWCHRNYKPDETSKLRNKIKKASIVDVRSILTSASRSERFSTGSWQNIIENNELEVVIERAKKIINITT